MQDKVTPKTSGARRKRAKPRAVTPEVAVARTIDAGGPEAIKGWRSAGHRFIDEQDAREFEQASRRYARTHLRTPEAARRELVASGIIDEDGNLTEHYR